MCHDLLLNLTRFMKRIIALTEGQTDVERHLHKYNLNKVLILLCHLYYQAIVHFTFSPKFLLNEFCTPKMPFIITFGMKNNRRCIFHNAWFCNKNDLWCTWVSIFCCRFDINLIRLIILYLQTFYEPTLLIIIKIVGRLQC